MIRRCRLISSDNVDFGYSDLRSDLIERILGNIPDGCQEPCVSLPFLSSSVLEFVLDKTMESEAQDVAAIRAVLGVASGSGSGGDLVIEKIVSNNNEFNADINNSTLDESHYLIKVEIEETSVLSEGGNLLDGILSDAIFTSSEEAPPGVPDNNSTNLEVLDMSTSTCEKESGTEGFVTNPGRSHVDSILERYRDQFGVQEDVQEESTSPEIAEETIIKNMNINHMEEELDENVSLEDEIEEQINLEEAGGENMNQGISEVLANPVLTVSTFLADVDIGDSSIYGRMMNYESDVAEDDIPQCHFADLVDEVLEDDSDTDNRPTFVTATRLPVTPIPMNTMSVTSRGQSGQETLKVKLLGKGIPLIKDIRKNKAKRGRRRGQSIVCANYKVLQINLLPTVYNNSYTNNGCKLT